MPRSSVTIILIAVITGIGGLALLGFLFYQLFNSASQAPTPISISLPAPQPESAPTPVPQPVPGTWSATSTVPATSTPQLSPALEPVRDPKEVIIRIDSSGRYNPSNVTIISGDSLTFINDDNTLHWPGADPHPTDSSYPGFSALGGISKGQRYSFTFRLAGTYGYHDHLLDSPVTIGTITILPLSQ